MRIIKPKSWREFGLAKISAYNMGYGNFRTGEVMTARIRDEAGPRAFMLISGPLDARPTKSTRFHTHLIELGEAGGMAPHDVRPFWHTYLGPAVIWAYATGRGPRGGVVWGQRYAPLDLVKLKVYDIREIPRPPGVSHKNVIPHDDVIIYHPGRRETMCWWDLEVIKNLQPLEIDIRGGSVPLRITPEWSLAAFHTTTLTMQGYVYEGWLGFVDNSGIAYEPMFLDTDELIATCGLTPPSWETRKIKSVVFPMGIRESARTGNYEVISGIQDQATYIIEINKSDISAGLAELSATLKGA